jgi:hypothetical protein
MREVESGESPFDRRLDRAPTADEVLDEVSVVVGDAWRFHTEEGIEPTTVFMTAQLVSGVRDFDRPSGGTALKVALVWMYVMGWTTYGTELPATFRRDDGERLGDFHRYPMKIPQQERLSVPPDQVRGPLGDHDHRRIRVPARDLRHHRRGW